jgi:FAD/FMN-containing dehydrogenase/Fe-S oxidoreductase
MRLPILDSADEPQSARTIEPFLAQLRPEFSGELRFDRLSRALYSTDASVYQIVPLGIALPRCEADIVAIVKACRDHRIPITARGGGTSQAGQSIGPGVILDASKHFHAILEINPQERWARVEPGCVLDDLNRALQPYRLKFAPDISTANRATIAGMVANNSSGARSVLYGKTGDHVLELRVVLADGSTIACRPLGTAELEARCGQADREGECYRAVRELAGAHAEEIDRRYPRILRRVGGYDLASFAPRNEAMAERFNLAPIFVGSEGTLGIVVEARLRLVELPKAKAVLVAQFAHLLDALAATPGILAHRPAAVEVVDRYVLDSTRLNPEASRLRDFLRGDPGAILLIELYGDEPAELAPRLDALEAELRRAFPAAHLHRATESAAQARIWKLREMALGLSMAEKGDAKAISFVEDTAVAPERLRDYIAELLDVIARHGTTAGVYAHASVGCLHVRPVIDLKTEAGVRRFESIAADVAELVLRFGGALSGEHGDGLVRSPFQERMYGPVLYEAFRSLKRTFDPDGLLNPGKIVDAPPLATNLRYGPSYVTPDVPTTFDFTADGGITRSSELCAGVGACRKRHEGTMCPSFQATRDERDSTRGRANALRLALTGQLGLTGLTEPSLHDVFDLCLECKACKAECPTNVDMARLKAEFLHQYHRAHGVALRNRLFGNVSLLARWGARLAPLSSAIVRSAPARWLAGKSLGIDPRRLPPPFARRTLRRRVGKQTEPAAGSAGVLLFPDTFASDFEPEVGEAALLVFSRLGLETWLGPAGLKCCARPLISNGLLDEAVAYARHNVALLEPWARSGRPIVACEPSCILTLKDDYPALLRGSDRSKAETVAGACRTFEECVADVLNQTNGNDAALQLGLRASRRRIFVQTHCHQRSLVGTAPSLQVLRQIPGAEVVDLDAGCCGMAGSFGYEAEHYEVSRLVGEQRLFPAIRKAEIDDRIVASGFSCRLQIAHFTGRSAIHPARLIAELVSGTPEAVMPWPKGY